MEQPADDQGDLAPEDKRGNRDDEGSQPSEVHRAGYDTRRTAGDDPNYRPD